MRFRFALLVAAATTFAAVPASAQNAEAVKHFVRGKELRDTEHCKEAIVEFQASLKIEESIGGFYNLGFCQEKLGNKHDALEAYTRARDLARTKGDDRLREIGASREALLQTSPHVKLTLPSPLPAGLTIQVDGVKIPPAHYAPETVIFTAAGNEHRVLVTAPGYEDRQLKITSDQAVPVELRKPPDTVAPPPRRAEGGWMWQHWAGLGGVVVGAGLAVYSIASFIGYNVRESKLQKDFDEACIPANDPNRDPRNCTDPELADQRQRKADYDANETDARSSAPLWIGVGGFGALMIGGGIALMVLAPIGMGSPTTVGSAKVQLVPQLGKGMQGLTLTGTF